MVLKKGQVKRWAVPGLILGLLLLGMLLQLQEPLIRAGGNGCSIGFVSVEAIFQVHPQREKAEAALQERAMELQQQLEEEAQDLEVEEQQQLLQQYQQMLGLYEQELINEVIYQIEDTIAKVAVQEGVAVVLEASHVIYGGLDLTDMVIAYLKQE